MDPAGGDGVPFGVNLRTATRQTTQADTTYNGAKQDDSRQNPGTGTEVGDMEGQTPTGPVYQPDLPSPQEGRIAATSGQSEATELFDGKMQIQNGECENIEGPCQEERLDGLDRPEGRLSLGTNRGRGQEISPVCMGGESVRVSVSPLWPQQCSKGFHEATETGNGPPQTEGVTEHDLPRRYVADGRIKTRSGTPVTGSPGPSQAARVQDQLGKVSATPNTQTGVSGPHNRHNPHDSDLTGRKGAEDSEEMPINSQQEQSVSEGLVEANWNDVGNNTGGLASPTTLKRAPGIEDKNTEENTVLPDYGVSEQGVENRAGVVDDNAQQVERPPNSPSDPRPRHRNRCITPVLGSGHRADEHRQPLVRGGENPPHKSPGASRRSSGREDLHEGQEEYPCPSQNGQHDGHSIHQQDGRHKVSDPIPDSLRSLALVPPAGDNPVSSTPAGRAELHSGRRVQDTTVVSGVDAREVNLSQCHTDPGPMLSGPLCHSPQQPAGEVRQLAPRPVRDRNGCLYYVVAGGSRVCISPVLRDRQMPTESSPGGVYSGSGDPRVGRPALVPGPA